MTGESGGGRGGDVCGRREREGRVAEEKGL